MLPYQARVQEVYNYKVVTLSDTDVDKEVEGGEV